MPFQDDLLTCNGDELLYNKDVLLFCDSALTCDYELLYDEDSVPFEDSVMTCYNDELAWNEYVWSFEDGELACDDDELVLDEDGLSFDDCGLYFIVDGRAGFRLR